MADRKVFLRALFKEISKKRKRKKGCLQGYTFDLRWDIKLSNLPLSSIQTELYHYAKSCSCLIFSLFLFWVHCLLAKNHLRIICWVSRERCKAEGGEWWAPERAKRQLALPWLPKARKQFYCNQQWIQTPRILRYPWLNKLFPKRPKRYISKHTFNHSFIQQCFWAPGIIRTNAEALTI